MNDAQEGWQELRSMHGVLTFLLTNHSHNIWTQQDEATAASVEGSPLLLLSPSSHYSSPSHARYASEDDGTSSSPSQAQQLQRPQQHHQRYSSSAAGIGPLSWSSSSHSRGGSGSSLLSYPQPQPPPPSPLGTSLSSTSSSSSHGRNPYPASPHNFHPFPSFSPRTTTTRARTASSPFLHQARPLVNVNVRFRVPMRDRLVLLGRLGQGCSGIVHKAFDLLELRLVALKVRVESVWW